MLAKCHDGQWHADDLDWSRPPPPLPRAKEEVVVQAFTDMAGIERLAEFYEVNPQGAERVAGRDAQESVTHRLTKAVRDGVGVERRDDAMAAHDVEIRGDGVRHAVAGAEGGHSILRRPLRFGHRHGAPLRGPRRGRDGAAFRLGPGRSRRPRGLGVVPSAQLLAVHVALRRAGQPILQQQVMAVAEGFEPPVGFNQLSLSRRVH